VTEIHRISFESIAHLRRLTDMTSSDIWDNSWVPFQLGEVSSFLERHSHILVTPPEGLPSELIEMCQRRVRIWEKYRDGLQDQRHKEWAGLSETSPSLESPHRFRESPAKGMFEAVFFGLLRTRLAVMSTQYLTDHPSYPPITIHPNRPEGPSGHKRNIGYWIKAYRTAMLDYSGNDDRGFSLFAPLPPEPHQTNSSNVDNRLSLSGSNGKAGQLLQAAKHLEKMSSRCSMGANILWAAWGLRAILESPDESLVSYTPAHRFFFLGFIVSSSIARGNGSGKRI
jgi:hypothetical protein